MGKLHDRHEQGKKYQETESQLDDGLAVSTGNMVYAPSI